MGVSFRPSHHDVASVSRVHKGFNLTADDCLTRIGWQKAIFAEQARRSDLLQLTPTWPSRTLTLQVYRNQPFEFVAGPLTTFLGYAGHHLDLKIGDYDDSLYDLHHETADVVLLWLDFERYTSSNDGIIEWLIGRLDVLRRRTNAPILVNDWASDVPRAAQLNRVLTEVVSLVPDVHVFQLSSLALQLGSSYMDRRAASITGSTMSDAACVAAAKALGLMWLPALVAETIRAIVVDLDGTLYDGVLGEDGPHGIQITHDHECLSSLLLELRGRGVFLGALSRNPREDVVELFEARRDLRLQLSDFSATSISWEPKRYGMLEIAETLRVGLDTILMIDDELQASLPP